MIEHRKGPDGAGVIAPLAFTALVLADIPQVTATSPESDRLGAFTFARSGFPAIPDAVLVVALFGLVNALVCAPFGR